jgi:hypothetical protein
MFAGVLLATLISTVLTPPNALSDTGFHFLSALAVPVPTQSEKRGFHFVYIPPDAPEVGTVWAAGILGEIVIFNFSNTSNPAIVTRKVDGSMSGLDQGRSITSVRGATSAKGAQLMVVGTKDFLLYRQTLNGTKQKLVLLGNVSNPTERKVEGAKKQGLNGFISVGVNSGDGATLVFGSAMPGYISGVKVDPSGTMESLGTFNVSMDQHHPMGSSYDIAAYNHSPTESYAVVISSHNHLKSNKSAFLALYPLSSGSAPASFKLSIESTARTQQAAHSLSSAHVRPLSQWKAVGGLKSTAPIEWSGCNRVRVHSATSTAFFSW